MRQREKEEVNRAVAFTFQKLHIERPDLAIFRRVYWIFFFLPFAAVRNNENGFMGKKPSSSTLVSYAEWKETV